MKLEADCYIDQYHNIVWAKSLKRLKEEVGCKHAEKMYIDREDGTSVHIGYVIKGRWLNAFKRSAK